MGFAFLGFGPPAPPPSGQPDPKLKAALRRTASGGAFRAGVTVWSRLFCLSAFDWEEFGERFERCECRSFADLAQALRSMGWAGRQPGSEDWLFGVFGYTIPVFGPQAMGHELFHAAQDVATGLFADETGLKVVTAELSALTFGSPLLAPLMFGGIAGIVWAGYWLSALVI